MNEKVNLKIQSCYLNFFLDFFFFFQLLTFGNFLHKKLNPVTFSPVTIFFFF